MADKVVDASAIAAILFGEPEGPAVKDMMGDADLLAPALLDFELARVCLKKLRRHPEQHDALARSFDLRRRFAIRALTIDHAAVVRLAAETGLSSYDASYLWLARDLGVGLITLDRRLAAVFANADP
jgi:predicted nucleic acid-binding protein